MLAVRPTYNSLPQNSSCGLPGSDCALLVLCVVSVNFTMQLLVKYDKWRFWDDLRLQTPHAVCHCGFKAGLKVVADRYDEADTR